MGAGPPAYQVTKAALNALTRTPAGELHGAHIPESRLLMLNITTESALKRVRQNESVRITAYP
jgi:NAD(P)-dependent dehydrogenase (short-subunit alcohol dehydrogenase family)